MEHIYPRDLDEEGIAWVDKLLERQGYRLENWDRGQYLEVLKDLLERLGWPVAQNMVEYRDEKDLWYLDMWTVNLTAIAIDRGVLEPPSRNPRPDANSVE